MNIVPIQIPPETPHVINTNTVCPKAPQKNVPLTTWEHAVAKPKVGRKLIFDDDNPKNDFLAKNKKK
jgi:hypothetical protein